MVGKSDSHTKKDKRRFLLLQDVGCLPCLMKGLGHVNVDVHHLIEGGRRLGHGYTIGLDPWHHRGIPPEGMTIKQAEEIAGPSLALNKKAFVAEFGTEMELWEATNEAIEMIDKLRVG